MNITLHTPEYEIYTDQSKTEEETGARIHCKQFLYYYVLNNNLRVF